MLRKLGLVLAVACITAAPPCIGQEGPALEARTSLTGAKVPSLVCLGSFLRRDPGVLSWSVVLSDELGIDFEELRRYSEVRSEWLELDGAEKARTAEALEAMVSARGVRDPGVVADFRVRQLDSLRLQALLAQQTIDALAVDLDSESIEALRRRVRECEGVALESNGKPGELDSEVLEILASVNLGPPAEVEP